MLKVDSTLNHIPAGRNHVIGLHESINQPLVNIPNFGTAPTGAFVLGTRNDQGAYTVFVYLHQSETSAVVVYVSEPRHLTHEQYRVEEAEALRFVESMGFMVDNLHFPTLAPPEQETVMERTPLFRPPRPTLDLYDVEEEKPSSIFGGLSAQDSALIRQANALSGPAAPLPGPPAPLSGPPNPLSGPPTMLSGTPATIVGQPAPVMGQPAVPPMALRHSALSDASMPAARNDGPTSSSADVEIPAGFVAASGSIPTVTGSMTSPPTSGTVPPSVGSANSHISVPRPSPDPDALARLGRLLGTFIFLLAATAGWSCGTTKDAAAPRTVTAQLDLGNQQLAQGRWPEAIKAFGTALDEDGENFDALRGTGLAYLKLQRYEEAERFYRRALDANPKSSLSRNELAVVYMEQRRCQEAVPLFEKVLEDIFYPTPEFAEHNLALAYACLGRTDDAISRLDKLVTKRPYFCLGYLTLSQLASKSRRPEATIRACDDFVHHCEQNEKIKQQVLPQQSAMCYLRKGLAYAEMGDVESARTSFERCQSLGGVRNECTKSLELLPQ